jgi:tRNA pseudouridine55 synthase
VLDGFLNVNKPPGVTSRDVVDHVVRLVGRRVKAGHAGTLDPLATGVLVVALGSGTRLIELVQRQSKVYRTTIRLGARSDTLDADGAIVEVADPIIPTEGDLRTALASQVGTIAQVPPRFSALKVGGQRAYDLARAGGDVELAPRPVRIDRIERLSYHWPRLELEIECGSGTYIRSIARDLGESLGCGGLVEILVRTRIGPFSLEDAVDLDRVVSAEELLRDHLRPLTDAVFDWTSLTLDPEQRSRIERGLSLAADRLVGGVPPPGELALIGPDGRLVALARHDAAEGVVRPWKVLGRSAE